MTLVKTFNLVEKEEWDAARIYWSLTLNLLKKSDRQSKDLFGSVDEVVFSFVKNAQRHSNDIICSRSDCTEKQRNYVSIELDIL